MSKNNYQDLIDEIINEVEKELEESTATGAVAGYQTPNAFGNDSKKSKDKTRKVATQAGYTVVGGNLNNINENVIIQVDNRRISITNSDYKRLKSGKDVVGNNLKNGEENWILSKTDKWKLSEAINEGIQLTDIVKLAKAQDKGNLDTFKINKPFNVVTKTGIVKVTPVPITTMEKGKFVKVMHFKVGGKQFVKLSGIVKLLGIKENVTESKRIKEQAPVKKLKKRTNRWLELKNDDSMHGHKKLAMGLKELKYQLKEVETFFRWYNQIKNINELETDGYWKRTNKHIGTIKERLVNIIRTIQEIEK
jgi:hypothetical protein